MTFTKDFQIEDEPTIRFLSGLDGHTPEFTDGRRWPKDSLTWGVARDLEYGMFEFDVTYEAPSTPQFHRVLEP